MKNNQRQFGIAMRTFLIPFLLLPCFAQGEAFKCVIDGRTSYQAAPCASGDALHEELSPQAELNHAIYQGQDSKVNQLLKQMKDVHYLSPATSPSPFVTAIEKGYLKIVKALLDKGADPLARDAKGVSMLAAAIERAQEKASGISPAMYQCLSLALDKAAATGLLKPVFPLNATLAFSHKPDPVLLGYLLKYGADPGAKSGYGITAIEMAFNQNQPKMMKVILNAKPRDPSLNPDKMAYRALLENKPEMLKMLRAAGGDPIRYAKNDPQALFDALQPDRKLEELEFVLKSGANPNARQNPQSRITALSIAAPYPDKLLLLIKHGADVNAKGPAGTVLVNVLFRSGLNVYAPSGQTAAHYPSLEIARLLLGSGANVNGDIGGFGQFGALAATKPGDKAMIRLLLDHGATLSSNPDRRMLALRAGKNPDDPNLPEPAPEGPVTLAMILEREDLALAILERDRKIDPNDRLALVKATRKGWDKVALALLHMGADVNAAGDDGISALAIAKRKQNEVMESALIAAGAPASTPPEPILLKARDPFDTLVGNEIDRSVHLDPPSFALVNALQEQIQSPFAFYGKVSETDKLNNESFNYFEIVECGRSAGFQFLVHANLTGSIQVGLCDSDIPRLRALATEAEPSAMMLIESLTGPEMKSNPNKLKSMGWLYEKSMDRDGAEIFFFPVIVVGQGILVSSTVLIIAPDNSRAVILQADTMNLCENNRMHTPLCDNTQATLIDIAQHVLLGSASLAPSETKVH